MGLEVTTLMAIGAGVSAVGTVMQMQQGNKAAKNQKRAAEMQQRRQDVAAAKERRQQYRQARMARAQIASQAGASGVSETSGAISGGGIVGTQAGSNVSYLNQQQGLARQQGIFQTNAATAQGNAAMWGGVASLGGSIFSNAGSLSGMSNPFGGGAARNPFDPTGTGAYVQ